MSDPMTNTEVEDVLASIRRLVSDDKTPEPESETSASSDRLVLTPALRVMDDFDGGDTVESSEKPLVNEGGSDSEIDDIAQDQASDLGDNETPMADASAVGPDPLDEDDRGDVEAEHQADKQATELADQSIALDAVDLDQDTLMSIQDAFVDPEGSETAKKPQDSAADIQQDATSLSAKIAALETLIAGQTEEFEPDMVGDGDNAGTEPPALEWEDADQDVDVEQPSPAVEERADSAKDNSQIFSSDEDVLDEEALRDLVSDIVREELQGALGERITRNVRKLVRREIHRALAAQDLE